MRLDHRTGFVTGASKGVGEGIALALGRAGCNVAVNYFSDARGADDTVSELRNLGVDALPVFGNVGSASDVKEIFVSFRQAVSALRYPGEQRWRAGLGTTLQLQ